MEQQLLGAVEVAYNGASTGQDPGLIQQALQFLEQVKANTQEVWSPAWNIFAARSNDSKTPLHSPEQRLFALGLVTDFLEDKVASTSDPAQAVAFLQSAALRHFDDEYIGGTAEDGAAFIKNKYAQFLSSLLVQTYGLPPPFTLLPDLVGRMRIQNASSGAALNPVSTDMVLRLLHEVSINLGSDVTLRAVRTRERVARDTAIRDEIRSSQAAGIAEAVWKVIEESFAKVQELGKVNPNGVHPHGWTYQRAVEIVCSACGVMGEYASWIDIGLVVTQESVALLYSILQNENATVRSSASDTLNGIVSKGMKAPDKLTLLRILNLTTSIGELERKTRKASDVKELPDEEVTFREHLAKLANTVAIELARIVEDGFYATDSAIQSEADGLLLSHMYLILDLLTDDYDEMAEAVMPCIGNVLNIYKRLRRQGSGGPGQPTANGAASKGVLSQDKAAFLSKLMEILLIKMKFDEESEWKGTYDEEDEDDDSEETGKFLQLRKQLQQHAAAIAAIDENLFSTPIMALINETLDACDAQVRRGAAEVAWQRAELALFAVFFCGEVLATNGGQPKSGVGPLSFVIVPEQTPRTVRNKPSEDFLLALTLNSLGEIIQRFYQSSIASFPHPAVQMQFFECVVRYAAFFSVRPEMLADVFAPLLDWRGIHHERKAIRCRTNYLLLRFVKDTRAHIKAEFVQGILENMQDVLIVSAVVPDVGPGEDPLEKAVKGSAVFDGQLCLFETCGVLLQLLRQTNEAQSMVLRALIDPLLEQLRVAVAAHMANQTDPRAVLQVHHLFFATSNIAKGFPDISPSSATQTLPWMELFKGVIEQMLTALQSGSLSGFRVIRDAARGAFSRMVTTMGFAALPYVPALLQALLPRLSEEELLDFYSFLGLITAKYKGDLAPVVDQMLGPLLERTFYFLNQEVTGTDDALVRENLIKGYVNFLSTLIGGGLDEVLRSERNQDKLETVLQSLVFYATKTGPATVRGIANVLTRLVSLWLEKTNADLTDDHASSGGQQPRRGAASVGNGTAAPNALASPCLPLPGFEQFVYKAIIGLVFEIPSKSTFDFNDAQSQIALTELCSLTKAVYRHRGQEFVDLLLTGYLPSINCPAPLANDFVQAMQKQEIKVFKKSLESFILQFRGSSGA